MTWTAPRIERTLTPDQGDERTLLDAFLEFHRETFLLKCGGLTGEQLARRGIPPSTMSLLGLARHLTDVERSWFRRGTAGEPVDQLYWGDQTPDDDFDLVDPAYAERDYAAYLDEIEHCRAINRRTDLDATIVISDQQSAFTFRWIMVHMVEEYARHNGHADLLREQIDGETGE